MTDDQDTVRLQDALGVVCEMCGRPLSPAALVQTAAELAGYPEAAVLAAMRHVTRESGAWKYGDSLLSALLAHIHGTRDQAALLAWAAVMRSLERRDLEMAYSDPAVDAAVRMCGGRAWLCNMDAHTLGQVRRDFVVYYCECSRTEPDKAVAVREGAVVVETGTKCGRILREWPVCLDLPTCPAQLQLSATMEVVRTAVYEQPQPTLDSEGEA